MKRSPRWPYDEHYLPADAAVVRAKARRLFGRFGHDEVDDARQDAATAVYTAMTKYDPSRGSRGGFAATVVKNRLLTRLDARRARKRRIPAPVDEKRVVGRAGGDVDLQIDVRSAVASLPPDLLPVAVLLLHGHSRRRVAGELRISRSHLNTLVRRIAAAFEAAGVAPDGPLKKIRRHPGHRPDSPGS